MASSSSFSPVDMIKYEVFLSFRGEDTRLNFLSHLHAALRRKKIETFIDDQLIRGEEISPSLLDAIERSMISVVIFSKGYASSKWCLEELMKILECKNKRGQIVIPVFYHVDPSNVRNQTGIFGDEFLKLEERFQERQDMLERWRLALREASNIAGSVFNDVRLESELIEEVVKDILKRLDVVLPSDSNNQLVGAESSIRMIGSSLLSIGMKDVYCLGIWGIGGIGKTEFAKAITRKISGYFDGYYFIENIKESEKSGGLGHVGRKLLSAITEDGNHDFAIDFGNKRPIRKKILIVFDDVSNSKQIESIMKQLGCLKPGSRVIVTTRDKQVLTSWRVDEIYEVKELSEDAALNLFCRHAFGNDQPDVGYLELSNKILTYAKGVPLALKVLGRFLCGRRKEDWESAMHKLKRIPNVEILKVLKVSYDGLDDEEQNIFLDIACFFKGKKKDFIIKCLDACGFSAEIGISVLVDNCLLVIRENVIMMHDLLQEMGWEIVRRESIKDLGKRSRLWHHEDIYKVLTKNTGTEAIEGISLDMSKVDEMHLNTCAFSKMHNLRFLRFYNYYYFVEKMNKIHIPQGLEFGLTELRYLEWRCFPLKSLSPNIRLENLVYLKMPNSSIQELWKGVQNLPNLKEINLRGSKHLIKIPDLSLAKKNLERLDFKGCTSLLETHSSIQYLNKLVVLNLEDCSNLKNLSELPCNIEELYLGGTAIKELPSSAEHLSSLWKLVLQNCSMLKALPTKMCKLKNLKILAISGCSNLERLPDELEKLEALEVLIAERVLSREIPSLIMCWENIKSLSSLKANCCSSLVALSGLPAFFKPNFDFTSCLKLDPNEVKEIIQDAKLKMQSRATAWWELEDKPHWIGRGLGGSICLPGSEIPEWFMFKSMRSSINFMPPHDLFNNKFFGVAFTAVVRPRELHHDHDSLLRVDLKSKHKTKVYSFGRINTRSQFGVSDHFLFGFEFGRLPHGWVEVCSGDDDAFFQFSFTNGDGKRVECCEVTKCGVHFFYAQKDIADGKEESSRRLRLDDDDDDGEEEPQPTITQEVDAWLPLLW